MTTARVKRAFLGGLLALASLSAGAAQLFDLTKPDLGIDWSASPSELAVKFPGLKATQRIFYSYKGPLQFATFSYSEEFVSFTLDYTTEKLQSIYFGLDKTDPIQLIDVLSRELGPGRWASYREVRAHIHLFEWNVGPRLVELTYVSSSGERLSKPLPDNGGALIITAQRPAQTTLDFAQGLQKLQEAMRQREKTQ